MIKISHRGNINGPVLSKENRPSYIDAALGLGYDVEIDIRYIDGNFWLGHDEPQYKVDIIWLELRRNNLWIHCKNIEASVELIKLNNGYKYFCHTQDSFILISCNKLWVHDLTLNINNQCIIPLMDIEDILKYKGGRPYGICTDYASSILLDKIK